MTILYQGVCYIKKTIIITLMLIFVVSAFFLASGKDSSLPDYVMENLTEDQTAVRLTEYESEEVSEVYLVESDGEKSAIMQRVSSEGYNGRIEMLVTISYSAKTLSEVDILEHRETPDYGGHLSSDWFLKRFIGKAAGQKLVLVKLFNRKPEEVVAITGATRTSEGVLAGVNKAFNNYQKIRGGNE